MFRTHLRYAVPVAAVAMSLSSFTAAPAALTAASHISFAPRTSGPNALSNWAGYIATRPAGTFLSASAAWTEPAVTCRANHNLYAPWVGIDGDTSSTVEQTGVQTSCATGSPVDSAWYEMYPKSPVYYSNPVSVGDSIQASVTASGKTFTLKISDVTKGWTRTTVKTLASAQLKSAEAVIEAPGGYPKIPAVNFTNVLFNGTDLSTFNPVKSDSGSGGIVYKPGPITNGDDFSILPS